MHRQRDWEDRNPDTERENLKFKAVMAVSSPDDGETCNCQHGDHSNANGQQHGMFNQDLGRANWQGQGLPQPKQDKDSCQCDEKPAEHDKVPNADARISDKDMKENKKQFLNYSDEEIVEVDGKTTKKKKIKIKGVFYAFFKKLNLIINFILFPNRKGINRLHYFNANVTSCKHVLELYWTRK